MVVVSMLFDGLSDKREGRMTRTFAIGFFLLLTCGAIASQARDLAQQPHIVLFLVDDLGWQDVSEPFLYRDGQPVRTERNDLYRTPHIELLAAQGVKFTQAYAEPVCSPTRVSLMTGQNAARHRVTNWVHPAGNETTRENPLAAPDWRRQGMSPTEQTLPGLLREAGYHTVHVGKAHFGSHGTWASDPKNLGFDVNIAGSAIGHPGSYFGHDNYGQQTNRPVPDLQAYHGSDMFLTDALTAEACRVITDAVREERRFFIHLSHYAVHGPFQTDPQYAANYPTLEGRARGYATLIEGMDASLGAVLAQVTELGIGKETLVAFISDNGGANPLDPPSPPLRGKKGQLYEGGIRVPMIVAWAQPDPAHPLQQQFAIAQGKAHHGIVHVRDLFATLLYMGGADASPAPDSFNLMETLREPSQLHRPQTLLMHYPHGRHAPRHPYAQHAGSMYRQGPWKLIYNYETHEAALYQLEEDLSEMNNIADQHKDRTARMIRAMREQLDQLEAAYPLDAQTNEPVRPIVNRQLIP